MIYPAGNGTAFAATSNRATSNLATGRVPVRPVRHPAAIVGARARNQPSRLVARSQYAVKPGLMVMAEYAVVLASAAAALYVACGR